MKRLLPLALVALSGCTARELEAWLAWHTVDPAAAIAFANELPDEPALTNNHADRWRQIGWCESGSQVHHPPVRNRHGSFSGLYMIKSDVWDHYGGGEFAADAWQASEAQQTEVAERILADVGWRAWQCA